jgi:hypothetical protein
MNVAKQHSPAHVFAIIDDKDTRKIENWPVRRLRKREARCNQKVRPARNSANFVRKKSVTRIDTEETTTA